MKKKQILLAPLLLIILILTNGCKKDGAPGPAGPQGPPGENATAHITSLTFTMSSWSYTSPYYYRNLSVPQLTSTNIDSAAVLVYFSTIGSTWFALPYTQYNSPYDYYMGFASYNGNVQVTWVYDTSFSQGSDPNAYYGTTIRCKVIIVPPSLRKANVNHRSYNEVKVAYNLNE